MPCRRRGGGAWLGCAPQSDIVGAPRTGVMGVSLSDDR